jgi:XTP/dITP diphosphohydrolase
MWQKEKKGEKTVMSKPSRKVVFLVTGNIHKFNEARLVLSEFGLSTAMLNVDTVEIQADRIEDVAKASAIDAANKCCLSLIVEDAGLFIEALNGFPGPYSSYVFRTVGTKGILRLMRDVEDRNAFFESIVAFHTPRLKTPKCFHGKTAGKITRKTCGQAGFGFDPVFLSPEGGGRTFAEMSTTKKNRCSHRARAFREFAEWYISRF